MIQFFIGLAGFALWLVLNVIFWGIRKLTDYAEGKSRHKDDLRRIAIDYYNTHYVNGNNFESIKMLSNYEKYKVHKYIYDIYNIPIPNNIKNEYMEDVKSDIYAFLFLFVLSGILIILAYFQK